MLAEVINNLRLSGAKLAIGLYNYFKTGTILNNPRKALLDNMIEVSRKKLEWKHRTWNVRAI